MNPLLPDAERGITSRVLAPHLSIVALPALVADMLPELPEPRKRRR